MRKIPSGYVRLASQHTRLLAFGFLHAALSAPGQTFFIALFVASFGSTFGLSPAALGGIYLFATLASAATLPVVGHWIDRIDLRLFAAAATFGLGLACLIVAWSATAAGLIAAIFLLRLTGQGLMVHIEAAATARYFGTDRGKALAITGLGQPVAEGLLPPLAVALIAAIGWRNAYEYTGLAVLLIGLPLSQLLLRRQSEYVRPPQSSHSSAGHAALRGLVCLARSRFFWLALPLLLYLPFTTTALLFHIQIIAAEKGWSLDLVASAFAGLAILHGVGLLMSGPLIDRLSARRLVPLLLLPMMLGLALLLTSAHWTALFVLLASAGLSSGIAKTALSALWAEVYGIGQLGSIRSAATTLMVGATAAGPAAFGVVVEAGVPLGVTLGVLIAIGGLATALVCLAPRMPPAATSNELVAP